MSRPRSQTAGSESADAAATSITVYPAMGSSGAGDPPDWRITCFFVDKEYRHRGVAAAALKGALSEIARLGGGTVESSPEDVTDRKVSNSFLYNSTLAMFEQQGFTRTRQLGKNNWLVTKKVRARRA